MSTIAAAGSVAAVRRGSARTSGALSAAGLATRGPAGTRTLLVSMDRFRQQSANFGVFSRPGEPVSVSQHTDLLELDTLGLLEGVWRQVVHGLPRAAGSFTASVAAVDPGELTGLPGVEQVLALRRIRDEATSGRWDKVVVDCSGDIDVFTLLNAPRLLVDHLERLWPRHRRLAAAHDNPRIARAVAAVEALDRDCADVTELCTDPDVMAAQLVVTPDDHGVRMAQRYRAVLDLMTIPTVAVYANRADTDEPGHRSALARLGEIGPVPVIAVTALATPPATVAALRKLKTRFAAPAGVPVGPAAAHVDKLGGSGLQSRYAMRWRQPLPDPDGLALGRSGDDLLVTVCGLRRTVRLPSVLRRCIVDGATYSDGELRIEFRPDAAVWPVRGV
ncbi:ArsA family ATPase [Williamsia sterculiae]|uniref:Arsenite efflux ATP-binding protein ArsA n=1 Tax=Williamsia sterculiae TaxID=1344003 RepID=A0A1N7H7A1_9NOCA|nr:ArsA-related P-loop ATPase [Williamsia sterculiae]SIS20755.1 arsenite efflux ATP-binding protein ArsA [Williamsia sterculiae]